MQETDEDGDAALMTYTHSALKKKSAKSERQRQKHFEMHRYKGPPK